MVQFLSVMDVVSFTSTLLGFPVSTTARDLLAARLRPAVVLVVVDAALLARSVEMAGILRPTSALPLCPE